MHIAHIGKFYDFPATVGACYVAGVEAFVFDLDGVIWIGDSLVTRRQGSEVQLVVRM